MNAKNLPLKFASVLLLVVLSGWSLFANGLRLGIDLRGGHSLTYGITTNKAEIQRLEKQKAKQEEMLANETDAKKRERIQEAIERIDAKLERKRAIGEEGDLTNRMIAILKNRVDPRGLRNLEWIPLKDNRFEVRMPAASDETRAAKKVYERALDRVEERNVDDREIRRLLSAAPGRRQAEIHDLAGDNEKLAGLLEELLAAHDKRQEVQAGDDQEAINNAELAYFRKLREVREGNIDVRVLKGILEDYVSPAEIGAAEANAEDLEARQKAYEKALEALIEKHPDREAEIAEVDERYRQWASMRQRLEDPADLKRLIAKAGALEFRIAPEPPGSGKSNLTQDQYERYVRKLKEPNGPAEMRETNEPFLWFPIHKGEEESFEDLLTGLDAKGKPHVLLYNQPDAMMLSEGGGGWRLARAYETTDERNRPAVGFTFDELGAKRFAKLTGSHKGRQMAILLDDEAYSAPRIRSVISKSGIIEMGRIDRDEVKDLVRTLEAGALPGKLNPDPLAESTFGPSIGKVNRETGYRAAWMAMIAVAVFMLIYYLLAGLIANVALLLNIILVLGAMSLLSAVFTLPGIAGIILTIGIAVDANVLIFERLREEQAKSQSIRMMVKNAYDRAFSAIFDANVTTLITCLILGWVGTEEVRGFAITLGLGVMFSLFTALVVTRWIFQVLMDTKVLKKPVFMLRLIGVPKINWMSKRYIFWALSIAMIVMGIASLAWQGGDIWGIEFSAGTKATFQFRDDGLLDGGLPDDKVVRQLFIAAAREGAHDKLAATARVETFIDPEQAGDFIDRRDSDKDGKVSLAEWQNQKLKKQAFEKLDLNADGAIDSEEADKMPSMKYQLITTESDVPTIRKVAAKAFGGAQRRRTKCSFEIVRDKNRKVLGLGVNATGRTRVEAVSGVENEKLLADYEGGVMFVITDVDPPIDEDELLERIGIMRTQSDQDEKLRGLTQNETAVRLIRTDSQGRPEFAVLVRPMEDPVSWDEFAEKEEKLLNAALAREEALVAINYDPAIAGEAAQLAIIAVVLSWIAIVLYLWLRFGSIQWGLAAVICLIHDVVIVVGMVAVSGWLGDSFIGRALNISSFKIDLAMVAAILTVIGYSVNDTIVVFDRIRENRGKLTTVSAGVINASINQTLGRTLLTSGTTFIVVFIMYVWGGPGIRAFNYALLMGILFGTYSSVAVASPLLLGFKQALVAKTAGAEPAAA